MSTNPPQNVLPSSLLEYRSTSTVGDKLEAIIAPLVTAFHEGTLTRAWPHKVKGLLPLNDTSKQILRTLNGYRHRSWQDIEVYALDLGPNSGIPPQNTAGSYIDQSIPETMRRSLITFNACTIQNMCLWNTVKELVRKHPDFLAVQWLVVEPKPRHLLLYHDPATSEGRHPRYSTHTILKIIDKHGDSWVVDATGYQFGYPCWFYGWMEYRNNFIDSNELGSMVVYTNYQIAQVLEGGNDVFSRLVTGLRSMFEMIVRRFGYTLRDLDDCDLDQLGKDMALGIREIMEPAEWKGLM
ncbi:hypothetical protein BU24DRAFT_405917 [Aaosphaeria arxii CBS 175.79]|uniref:Uncharacterized protein n=1 Tax=Aaosphaeria arxii CBS 175.79 TaxID=1450172 RepID=A0A6A5Y3T7_9PLEO|nr:uncharacterized protein BU24DRAFT_405917 [Aaosphaeria arxii CBS 175.79]KAF2019214.1 hypothetical protein BU24DRAFT_405917 [Aaosphaeria arxii CBS 175.79]